jgi:hypothetical protein
MSGARATGAPPARPPGSRAGRLQAGRPAGDAWAPVPSAASAVAATTGSRPCSANPLFAAMSADRVPTGPRRPGAGRLPEAVRDIRGPVNRAAAAMPRCPWPAARPRRRQAAVRSGRRRQPPRGTSSSAPSDNAPPKACGALPPRRGHGPASGCSPGDAAGRGGAPASSSEGRQATRSANSSALRAAGRAGREGAVRVVCSASASSLPAACGEALCATAVAPSRRGRRRQHTTGGWRGARACSCGDGGRQPCQAPRRARRPAAPAGGWTRAARLRRGCTPPRSPSDSSAWSPPAPSRRRAPQHEDRGAADGAPRRPASVDGEQTAVPLHQAQEPRRRAGDPARLACRTPPNCGVVDSTTPPPGRAWGRAGGRRTVGQKGAVSQRSSTPLVAVLETGPHGRARIHASRCEGPGA